MLYERVDVSFYRPYDCFFNSLSRLIKNQISALLTLCAWNDAQWFVFLWSHMQYQFKGIHITQNKYWSSNSQVLRCPHIVDKSYWPLTVVSANYWLLNSTPWPTTNIFRCMSGFENLNHASRLLSRQSKYLLKIKKAVLWSHKAVLVKPSQV